MRRIVLRITDTEAVQGITIRAVPSSGVLQVPAEGRQAVVQASRVVFRAQGMAVTVTIVLVLVVRSIIHRVVNDQVCLAGRVLFHVLEGEGLVDRVVLRPLALCPKTRVRQSVALKPKGPLTLAKKKNLRCRRNSSRPRRR